MDSSVIFGLSASVEDFLQEGGRVMRGGVSETGGRIGYSFFLHKGALGKLSIIVQMWMLINSNIFFRK